MAGSAARQRGRGLQEDVLADLSGSSVSKRFVSMDTLTTDSDERLSLERQALINERQKELKDVVDRHDDLVRETFHLEKFVLLLDYDPKIAKTDNSAVFQEYKLKHDLEMNTPGAGPSRTTRRAQNQRLSTLKTIQRAKVPLVSPVSDSASAPVISSSGVNGASRSSPTSISTALNNRGRKKLGKYGSSKLSAVAKGKQKESISDEEAEDVEEVVGTDVISFGTHSLNISTKGKGKKPTQRDVPLPHSRVSRSRSVMSEDVLPFAHGSPPTTTFDKSIRHPKRQPKNSVVEGAGFDDNVFVHPASPVKKSRSKLKDRLSSLHKTPLTSTSTPKARLQTTIPSSPLHYESPFNYDRPTVSGKSVAGKTLPTTGKKHSADGEPVSARPMIKRIKLIVREPPPTISSPRQKPPEPIFGKSLSTFLSSYTIIDGKEYDEAGLARAARQRAQLLDRIESLKKEGRLLWDFESVATHQGSGDSGIHAPPSVTMHLAQTHHSTDIWALVVADAISTRNKLVRNSFGRGRAVTSSIHSKMLAHWAAVKSQEDREVIAEERRLRVLAKSILKFVLGEWKKVVFHVREEERLLREAEEKRLGRQHLDAILDQSGQILEKQQMELGRTDVLRDLSRSATASVNSGSDEDDVSDDENDDESTDDESDSNAEEDAGEEDINDSDEGADPDAEPDGTGSSALVIGSPLDDPGAYEPDPFLVALNDVELEPATESESQEVESVGDELEEDQEEIEQNDTGEQSEEEVDQETLFVDSQFLDPLAGDSEDFEDLDGDSQAMQPDSSKASQVSTPIVDDLDIHGGTLPLGMSPDSRIEDISSPSLELGHDIIGDPLTSVRESHPNTPSIVDFEPPKLPSEFSVFTNGISISAVIDRSPKLMNRHTYHSEFEGESVASPANTPRTETAIAVSVKVNGAHGADQVQATIANGEVNKCRVSTQEPQIRQGELEAAAVNTRVEQPDPTVEQRGPSPEGVTKADIPEGSTQTVEAEPETEPEPEWEAPSHLQSFAVARVNWTPETKLVPPLLLRGTLRPYQQSGLEWLATLHNNNMNGILADEMGLGKTIQTIAMLAHLACDRGIWGPHLIVVPTSVLLNWEMEFKKFLPGFKILSYHGSTKRRKELRQGWNNRHAFNVCVTSYTLASRDALIFKRKAWYYMILDEAHMIKNFKSQRWNTLLMFKSYRRLLLTGTPLQNNLTELWALLRFLMSGTKFANLKEFGDWFSNPLEKAIEQGNVLDEEVQLRVSKLHTVLRPYLLRRLKRDVEKELPSKYDHLVLCRLSKRQRFLYDEFMSRSQTREDLSSGVYQKIANILMQLRKVCNHPDLFEVRPIVTSFAMERSAIADYEIKELLVRRKLLEDDDETSRINLDLLGLSFSHLCNKSIIVAQETRSLEEILASEIIAAYPGEPPPRNTRTIEGHRHYIAYQQRAAIHARWSHMSYLNRLRCNQVPIYSREAIDSVKQLYNPLTLACEAELLSNRRTFLSPLIKSYAIREEETLDIVDKFAFATPAVVARDLPAITLREMPDNVLYGCDPEFDTVLHKASVKLQIAFPDVSLLQYDCGKLQELARLLRERKEGGHRVLIFTQMTKILDILEIFLNFHGYLYLRLDGGTKIEDRQYITERFNVDERVFAFIASSRSGGVGINLTGADTVIFYDSDFNPQMDRQCEDRAHRIGQIRDVHIYRFISQYTVEEAMLRKANQKRSLDDLVIQQGEFDWRNFFGSDEEGQTTVALQKALVEFEDFEDVHAAKVAASEEAALKGEDQEEFDDAEATLDSPPVIEGQTTPLAEDLGDGDEEPPEDGEEEGGATIDYMLAFVRNDPEYFREWKV